MYNVTLVYEHAAFAAALGFLLIGMQIRITNDKHPVWLKSTIISVAAGCYVVLLAYGLQQQRVAEDDVLWGEYAFALAFSPWITFPMWLIMAICLGSTYVTILHMAYRGLQSRRIMNLRVVALILLFATCIFVYGFAFLTFMDIPPHIRQHLSLGLLLPFLFVIYAILEFTIAYRAAWREARRVALVSATACSSPGIEPR